MVSVFPVDLLPAALYAGLQFTPGNPPANVLYIISRLLCVSLHTSQHRGSVDEDCVGVDVPLLVWGVGIESTSSDVEGVRRDGMQGFCQPRRISHSH